jgi:hypothetical protein
MLLRFDMNTEAVSAKNKFIAGLDRNLCKMCGKDSTTAVQIYPSQAWEYYCKECYEKRK